MRIIIILLFVSLNVSISAQSTQSKYGKDSVTCVSNLSTMIEFAKIKVYDYALPPWRSLFFNCPQSSKSIYIYGASIYKYLIEQQENQAIKNQYIDTLMLIYDKRIEYFGEEGFVYIKKGMDLFNYRPSEKQTIYKYLNDGIKHLGAKAELNALIAYMQVSIMLVNDGFIDKEIAINNYNLISQLLDQLVSANTSENAVVQARDILDKMFAGSGLSDCDKTNEVYISKINSNNITIDQLKQILKTLEISRCIDSEAYLKAFEKLNTLEPSSSNASSVAKIYLKKQNFQKAEEYYKLALKSETESNVLANLYYELAVVEYSGLNQYTQAREYALLAAGLKKEWGQPYILIGNMYAASSNTCTGNEVEKLSVFWAAIDKFITAKNIDTTVIDEVNGLITRYSVYFPTNETLFFYGLKVGENYTVKCWINEVTKVRSR